jgi:hypothetical protein
MVAIEEEEGVEDGGKGISARWLGEGSGAKQKRSAASGSGIGTHDAGLSGRGKGEE